MSARVPRVLVVTLALAGLCFVCPPVLAADDPPVANWPAPPFWLPVGPVPDVTVDPGPIPGARGAIPVATPDAVPGADALPSGALPFFAISPCRIVDTRGGAPYGGGPFAPGETRTFDLNSAPAPCNGIPASAAAYSLNFTVVNTTGPGYFSAYPTGPQPSPLTSTINFAAGDVLANGIVVPADDQGRIDVFSGGASSDLVIDVNGYYAPLSAVTSLNTLTGAVTLAQGANVTITPSGNTLTIAASGGSLPSGTSGQTLRNDGTSWVAAGNLVNDGTKVGIGTTSPGQKLSVAGTFGILGGSSYSIFQGAAGQAADLTYTLPAVSANGVLRNTSGVLSWDAASAPVTSVFGRTGAVTAASGDYAGSQVTNTPAGTIAATTVQAAVNELDTEKSATSHAHTATGVTGLTSGGMLFGNASGNLGQSASSLFWDQTNGRLGVGTASPSALFELKGSGTQAAALQIDPYNTAAGNTGELRFLELAAGGTNYVSLKAPDALAANIGYTLPATSADGVLRNTSGVLSWDSSSGPATSVFGRTGAVAAASGDYTAAQVTNTPAGTISSTTVQAAVTELDTEKSATGHTHAASGITGLATGQVLFGGGTGSPAQTPNLFWNDGAVTLGVGGSVDVSGLLLLAPTSATGGQLRIGGSNFLHAYGSNDTFLGEAAGNLTTTGNSNTGIGYHALNDVSTGAENTAVGRGALVSNTAASRNTAVGAVALQTQSHGTTAFNTENTAVGYAALQLNQPTSATSGYQNTAVGAFALQANTIGSANVAVGHQALALNANAGGNVAVGQRALYSDTGGSYNVAAGHQALFSNGAARNVAVGADALYANTTGEDNTAVGTNALASHSNTDGDTAVGSGALQHLGNTVYEQQATAVGFEALHNSQDSIYSTALGYRTLYSNVTGGRNTAIGWLALAGATGSYNTALGVGAGSQLDSGDYNLYLGGDLQSSGSESSTIRIGHPSWQTRAFLAGVYGVTVTGGTAVYVDSDGQLGTVTSSRRYKRDIEDVGDRSEALRRLRPVAFRYTQDRDPRGEQQYGLIAEEVEEVAPELVVHDRDGRPETVKYNLVNALLLDEVLRQRKEIDELREAVRRLVEERQAGR